MHVEQAWLFVEPVVVYGDDVDSAAAQCLTTSWTSAAVMTKSPLIAARPLPVGWKLRAVARPMDGG